VHTLRVLLQGQVEWPSVVQLGGAKLPGIVQPGRRSPCHGQCLACSVAQQALLERVDFIRPREQPTALGGEGVHEGPVQPRPLGLQVISSFRFELHGDAVVDNQPAFAIPPCQQPIANLTLAVAKERYRVRDSGVGFAVRGDALHH
jgi:hypothetical protein